jgi:hypothetical protein
VSTYWHLVSIYIAMCDSMLSPKELPNDVASRVAPQMLRLVFEIYVRSVHVIKPDSTSQLDLTHNHTAKAHALWSLLDR